MLEYGLDAVNCLAFIGDGASVNHNAFKEHLEKQIPNAKFVICMAHSWNNVHGELIKNLPLLVKFLARVQKLFCHSGARKQQFKDFVMARGLHFTSPVFYCKTRWSTYLRSIRYWVKYIDEIEAFVEQLKVSGKVAQCLQYLREMFSNMDEKYKLLFQQRAIDHIGDRLEAELTKCENNSLPFAPYVLEATARISSTFEGLLLDNELDPHAPAEGRTNGWTRKLWYTESKTQLVAALTAAKSNFLGDDQTAFRVLVP
ncbi:hypothetical protein RvY_01950 [Ramazzottius varieornatus]|uniref:DUF659 domain-containing protein n=1 Tax=Ramazzottius varieornatus TaxID=947166 RepID=A0A1D1ULW1_RAMVA|nr:hypothetical protein RvY_01950 [Ramazzottius varieornatus]